MSASRIACAIATLASCHCAHAALPSAVVFRDGFRGADSGVADGAVSIISPSGWVGSHPPRLDPFEGTGNVYVSNKSPGWALGGEPNPSRETVILQTFGSTHTTITSGLFFTDSGAGTIDFARAGRDFLGGSGEGTLAVFIDATMVFSEFLAYGNGTYAWNTVSVATTFTAGFHTLTFKWSGQAPYAGREDSSVAIDWVEMTAPIPAPAAAPLLALASLLTRSRRRA